MVGFNDWLLHGNVYFIVSQDDYAGADILILLLSQSATLSAKIVEWIADFVRLVLLPRLFLFVCLFVFVFFCLMLVIWPDHICIGLKI